MPWSVSDVSASLRSDKSQLAGQKRKREHESADKRAQSFEIRSTDQEAERSLTLTPTHLLPRAHIPLSWLNPQQNLNGAYTGHALLLETTYDRGLPPSILISTCPRGTRCALERISASQYAVFALLKSVDEKTLDRRALWSAPKLEIEPLKATDPAIRRQQKRRVDLADIKKVNEPSNDAGVIARSAHDAELAQAHEEAITTLQDVDSFPLSQTSPEEAFQELTKHYLDDLYLSRTSLAYFVKGPLSRLRSLALDQACRDLMTSSVACFLRDMILTTSLTDTRLKEHIPNTIKSAADTVNAECADSKRPRKRKWKPKRDRQGYLSEEAKHIMDWWHSHNSISTHGTPVSVADALKHELAELRTRETFLQVIITLEVLALEWAIKKERESQPSGVGSQDGSHDAAASTRKAKAPMALDRHLESLLDRLVIWHSINISTTTESQEDGADQKEAPDELRNFCIEVIIPFFAPRIPKIAAAVSKKLGGPSARSPVKSSSSHRPGAPTARQTSAKSRSSLPASGPPPAAISLHRSATDSQVSVSRHVRRDSSISLSMQSAHSDKSDPRRPFATALNSLSKREIDLTAASEASREKLRKRSEQEARVREAVAGIRKPDRASALQENAALIDAKFAQSLQRPRKPALTSRRSDASSADIHIHATPRLTKTMSAPVLQMETATDHGALLAPSANADSLSVPQTGHRARIADMLTPSKSSAPIISDSVARLAMDKSPLLARRKLIESTPSRPRSLFAAVQIPSKQSEGLDKLNATTAAVVPLSTVCPNAGLQTPVTEKSLYDVLGWNDEYEELS